MSKFDAAKMSVSKEQIMKRADAFGCFGIADVMGILHDLGIAVNDSSPAGAGQEKDKEGNGLAHSSQDIALELEAANKELQGYRFYHKENIRP